MIRLGLLGAGRIGALHAGNVHASPRAVLTAIFDVNSQAAAEVAAPSHAKVLSSAEALIDHPEVDAVLICTSTDTHVSLIEASAQAQKPIFCEKPIDLDLARVDACLQKVEAAKTPLMLGFNRRFDPNFAELKERMDQGVVGKAEVVKITSRDPGPPPLSYVKVSGGLFRDMMIHDFDMARFLLGQDPVEVFASASCLVDPDIGEVGDVDTAMVILKTRDGQLCHIDNSRRAVYGYDQRVEVLGAKGMLQANNQATNTLRQWGPDGVKEDPPPHFFLERYQPAFRAELDHFLDVVEKGVAPLVGSHDGRQALALADAALLSFNKKAPVSLKNGAWQ